MKQIIILILSLIFTLSAQGELVVAARTNLHGKITDKKGEPVVGASVYIPELKTGGVTDLQGE